MLCEVDAWVGEISTAGSILHQRQLPDGQWCAPAAAIKNKFSRLMFSQLGRAFADMTQVLQRTRCRFLQCFKA